MKTVTFIQLKDTNQTIHQLDFLLPNVFIGMSLWIEGNNYKVIDLEYDFPTLSLSRLFIIVE